MIPAMNEGNVFAEEGRRDFRPSGEEKALGAGVLGTAARSRMTEDE